METVLTACHWCWALSSLYQADLHEEQSHLHRAWRCWKEKINDKEKQSASIQMYLGTIPYTAVIMWKDIRTEIQDRWNKTKTGVWWTCSVWSQYFKLFCMSGDIRGSRLVLRVTYMSGNGLWTNANRWLCKEILPSCKSTKENRFCHGVHY